MTDPPVVQSATYPFRDAADLCAYQEARLWGEPGGQGAEGRRVEYGRYGNPAAAALLTRGLTTLGLRVERHNANALRVAEFLEGHPSITRVWYPGLRSHPDHAVARALMLGYGGVVSFEVGDALEDASRFIDATRLPIIAPSLGGAIL